MGNRQIDIQAIENAQDLVVVEMEVSKGHDRAVGQILQYVGDLTELGGPGQKVKGMLIARSISDDLSSAISRISNVELYEYALSISLTKIDL